VHASLRSACDRPVPQDGLIPLSHSPERIKLNEKRQGSLANLENLRTLFIDPQEHKGHRGGCHAFAAGLGRERTLNNHGEGMRGLQGQHAFAVIPHDSLLRASSAKAWHPAPGGVDSRLPQASG